jgi:polar amino acid transport system substrate-binding protein
MQLRNLGIRVDRESLTLLRRPSVRSGQQTPASKHRLFTSALLIAIFALASAPSYAGSTKSDLRLAVINDVPSTQLAIRILNAAYEKLGIRIETSVFPSRRALLMADQGRVDGDLFRVEEVASQYPNLIQVPYPLMQGRLLAIVSAPHEDHFPNVVGRPLVAAVRRGVIIAETTAKELGMKPILANSYRQMKNLLEQGRVDVMLLSDIEGLSPASNSEWNDLVILSDPVTRFYLYHYLHRHHSELAIPLAKALRELDLGGEKTRLIEKARAKPDLEQW